MDFKEFVTQSQPIEPKLWKAKRKDIFRFWRSLKNNLPLRMMPVPKDHEGTRFDSDGLRITGSPEFINSVLGRIKELLNYELNSNLKLDIEYRQIEGKDDKAKPVYACYIHLVEKE